MDKSVKKNEKIINLSKNKNKNKNKNKKDIKKDIKKDKENNEKIIKLDKDISELYENNIEEHDIVNSESNIDENNFNEVITFTEKKKIEEKFPNNVLENILVNEFLKEYPVYLQSNKSIQNDVFKKVTHYIDRYSVYKDILKDTNYLYNVYYKDIQNDIFCNIPWLYPVVIDIKKIYSLFCEEENIDEKKNNTLYYEILEDQKEQIYQLHNLQTKYYKNEITRVQYNKEKRSIIEPYIVPDDTILQTNTDIPQIKKITLDNYTHIARYNNILHKNYIRVGRGKEVIKIDNENKSLINKDYITSDEGEKLYIVGFLFSPFSNNDKVEILELSKIDTLHLDKKYFIPFPKRKKENFISDKDYTDILLKCIPSYEKILQYTITNKYTLEKTIHYIESWGYSLSVYTNNTLNSIIQNSTFTKIQKEIVKYSKIQGFLQKKYFSKVPFYKNIEDIPIEKVYHVLHNTNDNGNLFYIFLYLTYYYKNIKSYIKVPEIGKQYTRFDTSNIIEKLENKKILFSDIKKYIEKNPYKDNQEIQEIIEINKKEYKNINTNNIINLYKNYYRKIENYREHTNITKKYNNNNDSTITIKIQEKNTKTKKILEYINSISSSISKKNIIYKIIELDGVLINNFIHSIYYKEPLFCGHWYYYYKIENSTDRENIINNSKILLSLYSDKGRETNSCHVCGGFLEIKDYDEGYIYESSINYTIEDIHIPYAHLIPSSIKDYVTDEIKNSKSEEFISYLSMKKIDTNENIRKAKIACDLLSVICNKVGLDIPNNHFISLVLTSVRDTRRIQIYETYMNRRISNLEKKKKYTKDKINTLIKDALFEKKMRKSYYIYYMSQYLTLIISHLLWYLRCFSHIITPKNDIPGCSYITFDDEEGIYYMLCIIIKLKLSYIQSSQGTIGIQENIPKEKIQKSLLFWISILQPKYEEFYINNNKDISNERRINNIIGSYRVNEIKEIFNWSEYNVEEKEVIFDKKLSVIENINTIHKYINKYTEKYFELYLQELMTYDKIFGDSESRTYSLVSFHDKKTEYSSRNTDILSPKYIRNICKNNILYEKMYNTLYTGSLIYSNSLLIQKHDTINYNIQNISIEKKKNIFIYYCYEGKNKGRLHNFYKYYNIVKKCIYCKKTYEELFQKNYSEKEYIDAYNEIQNKNIIYFQYKKEKKIETSLLKKDSTDKKYKKILSKISKKISKKSSRENKKKVEDLVYSFFQDLRNFDNILYISKKNRTKKDKILYNQYIEQYSIKKCKSYINDFFRKNISRIQNGFTIPKIKLPENLKKTEESWFRLLENQYTWLEPFITEKNKKIFSKCIFNYSRDKIHNLKASTNIYDRSYIFKKNIKDDFNTYDILQFLVYYFVSEIQLFMNILGENSTIFSEFCIAMIEEIKKDKKRITISEDKFQKWKNDKKEKFIIKQLQYKDVTNETYKEEEYNPLDVDKYTIENNLLSDKKKIEENEKKEFMEEQIQGDNKEEIIEEIIENNIIDSNIEKEIYESVSVENEDSLEKSNDIEEYEYQNNNNNSSIQESIHNYIIEDDDN